MNNNIDPISSIRDLGITLTHNLNFQEHIECIVKKITSCVRLCEASFVRV